MPHNLAVEYTNIKESLGLPEYEVLPGDAKAWWRVAKESLGVTNRERTACQRYIRENSQKFSRDYPMERCWWLASFHDSVADFMLLPKGYPWPTMYATMLGEPYLDLPAGISWRQVLGVRWKDLRLQMFREFRRSFEADNPLAKRVEAVESNARLWERWDVIAFASGFDALYPIWTQEAEKNLRERKDLVGVIY